MGLALNNRRRLMYGILPPPKNDQPTGSNRYEGVLHSLSFPELEPHHQILTAVECDEKAPFSIATTPRYRGGCYSFPWIATLYP